VIQEERNMLFRQLKKNGIQLILGLARFENPNLLLVMDREYRLSYQVTAEHFIIATGSQPRNPANIPFDKDVILDSTRLLQIEKVPKRFLCWVGDYRLRVCEFFCCPGH